MTRAEMYEELVGLTKSPLYQYRKDNGYKPVLGEGSLESKLLFVGEAPGEEEALSGHPFIGKSGQYLRKLMGLVGIQPLTDAYITNLVLDRPPDNRDPSEEEVRLYSTFLDRHIRLMEPKIIVSLGRYSMAYLINRLKIKETRPVSVIAGNFYPVCVSWGHLVFVPMYHPAAVGYRPSLQADYEDHFHSLGVLVNRLVI